MYTSVHVSIYVGMQECSYVCIYKYAHVCEIMYVGTSGWMYKRMNLTMCLHIDVSKHSYIFVYI